MSETPITVHGHLLTVAQEFNPSLAEAMVRIGPVALTPRRGSSPLVDSLCRAVAGQQLSVKAAATIWNRVLERAGDQPLAAFLATTDPEELRQCGLSRAKSRTVRAVAEAAQAGTLDEDELAQLEHRARVKRLTVIWGVGPWTADMMGLFFFGDPDVWPDGDLAVRKTMEQFTPEGQTTRQAAARFAPYRSYLAVTMWRLANSGAPVGQTY